MMKIYLNWEVGCGDGLCGKDWVVGVSGGIKRIINEILRKHKAMGRLSITFCDDKFMKKLNAKYRGKNKTTDVLSFEIGDKDLQGDIYISLPTAIRQAKEYNVPLMEELIRLSIHGTLHVLGYKHKEMGIYGN